MFSDLNRGNLKISGVCTPAARGSSALSPRLALDSLRWTDSGSGSRTGQGGRLGGNCRAKQRPTAKGTSARARNPAHISTQGPLAKQLLNQPGLHKGTT